MYINTLKFELNQRTEWGPQVNAEAGFMKENVLKVNF